MDPKLAREAVRASMKTARSKYTKEQIIARLFEAAIKLFHARGDLRTEWEILQDAYDDATGMVTKDMYGDSHVKHTKDMMYQLDAQMGKVANEMEYLARELKKK